jgi:alkylhydroperoxidase family enzyme
LRNKSEKPKGSIMTDLSSTRLTPLTPDEWNEDAMDALGAFPSSRDFVLKQWRDNTGDGRGSYTLGLFAHYPALAKAFMKLNKHVAVDSSLSPREKELIILRTSWLKKSEYEYVQHLILGARVGLLDEDFVRIQIGSKAEGWQPQDRALIQAVDDLHQESKIGDNTWELLNPHYNHQQILDVICLMGYYSTLAMAISSFNIPLEAGCDPIDDKTRTRMMAQ